MTGAMQKSDIWKDRHAGRTPCEDEGRDRGGWSYKPRTPRRASKVPGAGERPATDPRSQPQREQTAASRPGDSKLVSSQLPRVRALSQQETNADYLPSNGICT